MNLLWVAWRGKIVCKIGVGMRGGGVNLFCLFVRVLSPDCEGHKQAPKDGVSA